MVHKATKNPTAKKKIKDWNLRKGHRFGAKSEQRVTVGNSNSSIGLISVSTFSTGKNSM
jgi:ribosomal protein L5